jgi:hypothetical protein
MNRMTQKDYAAKNGRLCPFCEGPNLVTLENQCTFLEVGRACEDCGKEFTELHKITGYIPKEKGW